MFHHHPLALTTPLCHAAFKTFTTNWSRVESGHGISFFTISTSENMLHKTSGIFVGIFDSSFSVTPAEYIIVFGIYVHCLSAWEPEWRM